MTLEEVAYQIDGELRVERIEDGEGGVLFKLVLFDNANEVAVIQFRGDQTSPKDVEAVATGNTIFEARKNLVNLLRGNILRHDWPIMWTTSTLSIRIPKTLSHIPDTPLYASDSALDYSDA